MICNTAVFYDVENLIHPFVSKNNKTLQLDEIHRRILNLEMVQGISIQRAYADWAQQVNRSLRSCVLQVGIEPVQIFNTNQNDKVKNAADVSLIIDAVELIAKHPEVENYVIASGDGIFAFLAKKLHEHGKRVIGCGFDRTTNIIFQNSCDIFLILDRNDNTLSTSVGKPAKTTIHSQDPIQIPPKDKGEPKVAPIILPASSPEIKIPSKLPKNKFSEVLAESDISIWKNSKDQSGSLHVIKRMINVLFEYPGAEDLEISMFKAYLEYYLPNCRIGHYGFKRFGEFMRFLVTASPYCLILSEGTVVRITKRGAFRNKNDVQMKDMDNLLFTLSDGSVANSLFDIEEGKSFTFYLDGKKNPVKANKDSNRLPASASFEVASDAYEATADADEAVTDIDEPGKKSGDGRTFEVDSDLGSDFDPELNSNKNSPSKAESTRMWIKATFMRLSREDKITAGEIKRLQKVDFCQKTFGIRVPICKELRTRSHLREQRLVDGKLKYWKEEFRFKGKGFLIYKEWTDRQHRSRFEDWLKKIEG